jgi:hypothetical protein
MNAKLRSVVLVAGLCTLGGCYVYDPYYPYGHPPPGASPAATYDRAWNAALGAMRDQGVDIAGEDRSNGVIDGRRGGVNVRSRVVTQADGRVRVEFNMSGAMSEDPGLADRISRAYDARMGR